MKKYLFLNLAGYILLYLIFFKEQYKELYLTFINYLIFIFNFNFNFNFNFV